MKVSWKLHFFREDSDKWKNVSRFDWIDALRANGLLWQGGARGGEKNIIRDDFCTIWQTNDSFNFRRFVEFPKVSLHREEISAPLKFHRPHFAFKMSPGSNLESRIKYTRADKPNLESVEKYGD